MPETFSRFHLLSQRCQAILRYTAGPTHHTLEEFTPAGVQRVELDMDELAAFLRALPRQWLWEALGCTSMAQAEAVAQAIIASDEEEEAAELARLTGATHEASYPHCPNPDLCPGCVGACLLRDATARNGYTTGCRVLGETDELPPCEER